MKIAITYDVNTEEVYQHFGEVQNYLVYDTETKERTIIGNGGFSHRSLPPYLKEQGINVLICGGVGTPAVMLCNLNDIKLIPGVTGLATDALAAYLDGTLVGDESVIHDCGCHH